MGLSLYIWALLFLFYLVFVNNFDSKKLTGLHFDFIWSHSGVNFNQPIITLHEDEWNAIQNAWLLYQQFTQYNVFQFSCQEQWLAQVGNLRRVKLCITPSLLKAKVLVKLTPGSGLWSPYWTSIINISERMFFRDQKPYLFLI